VTVVADHVIQLERAHAEAAGPAKASMVASRRPLLGKAQRLG
jgi:hypothetical protein